MVVDTELLTQSIHANTLFLNVIESAGLYRKRFPSTEFPRLVSRRINDAGIVTVGQIVGIFLIPLALRNRRSYRRMLGNFKSVDLANYDDERADTLVGLLRNACDFAEQSIQDGKDLRLHWVLALRWFQKGRERVKDELEDILETWLLARNPEFEDLLSTVMRELRVYSHEEMERQAEGIRTG